MAIVKDFMMGPTHIIIDDSRCVTKEEAYEIIQNLSKRIQPHMCYVEAKERKREEESRKARENRNEEDYST